MAIKNACLQALMQLENNLISRQCEPNTSIGRKGEVDGVGSNSQTKWKKDKEKTVEDKETQVSFDQFSSFTKLRILLSSSSPYPNFFLPTLGKVHVFDRCSQKI